MWVMPCWQKPIDNNMGQTKGSIWKHGSLPSLFCIAEGKTAVLPGGHGLAKC